MILLLRSLLLLCAAGFASSAWSAASFASRPAVHEFIGEMREKHGFDGPVLIRAFARIKPLPAVIKAVMPPRDPGIRSWQAYRARYVEAKRIGLGLDFWQEYRDELAAARQLTGVPEEIVVAIIGVETIYGRYTGDYVTLAALSTLAFDYPATVPEFSRKRRALFRRELEELLLLARESRRDPLSFKGSYAGALGLPQFLPGSIRHFAVDGDGDGRIDLAKSPRDAIASVANFLREHGWEKDMPVTASADAEGEKINGLLEEGIVPRRNPSELAAYGVTSCDAPEQPAALIDLATPEQPTEYRLGYRNFYVLTRYNRSSFYAAAVLDLAQELRRGRARRNIQ